MTRETENTDRVLLITTAIDRILRTAAGLVIIGIGVANESWWGLLGIIPIVTGGLRWCPANLSFKSSNCKK
jgi:hypothetical protein